MKSPVKEKPVQKDVFEIAIEIGEYLKISLDQAQVDKKKGAMAELRRTTEKGGTIKPLDTQEQKESHIDRLRAGRYKPGGHVKRWGLILVLSPNISNA